MPYLYLHGFASGPSSTKAQALQRRFQQQGQSLLIPDLNQGDFLHLTLTRQIQQAQEILASQPGPWGVIGSSFGGLTAAWLATLPAQTSIQRLVLLAPAFQFLRQWLPRLGPAQLQQWQRQGSLAVYHYGQQQFCPLAYDFILDAQAYDDAQLRPSVPTLILHGRQDAVIDIQASRDFAACHGPVDLIELESDHALGNVQAEIWRATSWFLGLQSLP